MAGILVFAAKEVGLKCCQILFQTGSTVRKIFVGSNGDQELLDLARQHGVEAEIFSEPGLASLLRTPEKFEWLINLWSPHILSKAVLDLADKRLNAHPSLVPQCRGNDSAAWTIKDACPAGVSLIEMREEIDSGEIWAQRPIAYALPIRGRELHEMLQAELISLFLETWPRLAASPWLPAPQAGKGSLFRRRDTEADRKRHALDRDTLEGTIRWALAHDFFPLTTAEMDWNGKTYRVRVTLEAKADAAPPKI
ncbi:MAG: hypothetical protein IT565_13680 [Rhodospirillales bacterium]|nr:hypothetical protein [Rhodospirillales bacterium]